MTELLLASAQAALLAFAILLADLVARGVSRGGLPAAVRYGLWWVVVLRLALPAPLPDPLGWERPTWWSGRFEAALPEATGEDAGSEDAPAALVPRIEWGAAGSDSEVVVPVPPRVDDPQPLPSETGERRTSGPAAVGSAGRASGPRHATSTRSFEPGARPLGSHEASESNPAWTSLLTWAWLCGVALCLLRAALGEAAFRRRVLRHARVLEAGPACDALTVARRALRVGRRIDLLETDALDAPAAHGLLRARVLLPAGLAERLDPVALEFALRHELAHLQHRDPLVNLLLAAVEAVHWFNPLAWLATARLREERELLRDEAALCAAPRLDPDTSARSLLDVARAHTRPIHPTLATLAPRRRASLRRRLEMILSHYPSRRAHALLGAVCCLGLGWAGLSAARPVVDPVEQEPRDRPRSAVQGDELIRVVRRTPAPAWEAEVEQKLGTMLRWGEGLEVEQWSAMVARETGLKVRFDPDVVADYGLEMEMPSLAAPLPLRVVLDHLLWSFDTNLTWRGIEGGVWIGRVEDERDLDLRFYDTRRLLEDHDPDLLQDLVYQLVPGFDEYGSMEFWQQRMLIRQTPREHGAVHRVLEHLARGPAANQRTAVPAALAAILARKCDFEFEGPQPDALRALAAQFELPLFFDLSVVEGGEDVVVEGEGRPVSAVLADLACGGYVTVSEGAVLVGRTPPLTLRLYDVADLVEPTEGAVRRMMGDGDPAEFEELRREAVAELRDHEKDHLMDLLRSHVSVQAWDELDRAVMAYWGNQLVIAQTEPVHDGIEAFLSAARQALAD